MMDLSRMVERCRGLEERAAALYRSWAAGARDRPDLSALWTRLARGEEEHARSLAALRDAGAERTSLEGWEDALDEIEQCLGTADQLGTSAAPDRQLAAALDLEMTELDALRRTLLVAAGAALPPLEEHAEDLANTAVRHSTDPHVQLQAALLLARARLTRAPA
jgi:rubrerythrin